MNLSLRELNEFTVELITVWRLMWLEPEQGWDELYVTEISPEWVIGLFGFVKVDQNLQKVGRLVSGVGQVKPSPFKPIKTKQKTLLYQLFFKNWYMRMASTTNRTSMIKWQRIHLLWQEKYWRRGWAQAIHKDSKVSKNNLWC